jgi:hypothetical protein
MLKDLIVVEHIKFVNNEVANNKALRYVNFIDRNNGAVSQTKIENMKLLLSYKNQLWFVETEAKEDVLKLKIYDFKHSKEI